MITLSGYEEKKKIQIMMMYGLSEVVSAKIVLFGSRTNNKMVSHWFVNAVATYINGQIDVTEDTIDMHLGNFYNEYVRFFGAIPPEPIELSEAQKLREEHYMWLDSATRHIKKMQKELDLLFSFSPKQYGDLCYHWGTLYMCCKLLKIPVLEYCKETFIPYKKSGELYEDFFMENPNDPHQSGNAPMLAVEYFLPIIMRLENTAKF